MRVSTLFGRTLREVPSEAVQPAHQLVLRAGLVRTLPDGSPALLPLGTQVSRRIEMIMHAEMQRTGAQELRLLAFQGTTSAAEPAADASVAPAVQSPSVLLTSVIDLACHLTSSYRQLPVLLYRVQTLDDPEIRPRGGLLYTRVSTALEACALAADADSLDHTYTRIADAFERILARCDVRFISVATGDTAAEEGVARAYVALSPAGETTLVRCPTGDYAATLDVATSAPPLPVDATDAPATELVATPDCNTIAALAALLNIPTSATAKAVFFDTPERGLLFVVIRGDLEVSKAKLRAAAGVSRLVPARTEQIAAHGAVPGYASPVGLHGVTVIADRSVVAGEPLVAGANQAGYHLRNVVYGRDWEATQVADIATVRAGDACLRCGVPLGIERGVELGRLVRLGTSVAGERGAVYLDPNGVSRPVMVGACSMPVERLLQVIVEQHHDESGIIWPAAVTPADVHLVRLGKKEPVRGAADDLYAELQRAGLCVLYDDRDDSAGVKFNDADLIGLPVRLVVGDRTLASQSVEVRPRDGEAVSVSRAEVVELVRNLLQGYPA